jgi:uncharacterized lipoprotein YajG
MKKLIIIALLALAGCATTQSTQVAYVQACGTYAAALNIAVSMLKADKLTPAEITQITALDAQIYPICTGALPVDPTAATQQITAAITTLTILETVKKVAQ